MGATTARSHPCGCRYQALFQRIDEALCVVEPLVDERGLPFDYRFLEVNPAFVLHTGYQDAVGKTACEINCQLEPEWPELVHRVARTGRAVRVEGAVKDLGRWYEVFAFPAGDEGCPSVAMLFRDVSGRKRSEQSLRANETRQAFLVQLADALRPLSDPVAVQHTAADVLGEQLRAARVVYGEVARGADRELTFPARLLDAYREGRTTVSVDTQSDPTLTPQERATFASLQIGAHIGVPLVKGGRLVAVMTVDTSAPRAWTAEEVRLTEETAERTWAAVERARAERKLTRTNLRLNDMLASIHDEVYALDREWRFVAASRGLCARIGRAREELLGRSFWELFPFCRGSALEEHFHATMELGQIRRFESEASIGGGTYHVTSSPSADGMVVVATNITEQRRAEAGLREAVSRHEKQVRLFESVASTTPDFVFVFDLEGKFVYANRGLLELWGLTLPEALGKTCREVGYAPWHHDLHMRELAQVVATKVSIKGEVRFHAERTGSGGVYEYILAPVIGPTGEVELVAGTSRDVTERKRDEEALRESEARLRPLWESGMMGVLLFDLAAGSITDANDRFLEMIGYTRDDLRAGRISWSEMTPDEYRERDARAADELHATGVDTPYEKEFVRKDGSRVPIFIGAATFDPENNRGISFVVDISKAKQLEHALRRANQQLVESDQRKNHFLAVLSHELRNPLTPIKNSLHILDRAVPGSLQGRRAKAVIERQVDQLAHLVDDLLDVTRITRGKIQLHRRPLELNELVERTLDDHAALFQSAGVTLEMVPSPEPLFTVGDWNRTAQVMSNLLQNSAKFTPRGGLVTVTLERDGLAAVIRVVDTGVGMKPELLQRIFEPFTQADETLDRSRGGLGLGLALVKGIVEQHGGSVHATSAGRDRGSELVVRLPIDLTTPTVVETLPCPTAASRQVVLVIEDNVDAAQSLKEVLELLGHEVEVAHDGHAGLQLARCLHPDLVLCDIGLPGLDGYDVARAFRADDDLRGTHLIALSGYALPDDLQRAAEAGFERHLAKPASLESLEGLLGQLSAS